MGGGWSWSLLAGPDRGAGAADVRPMGTLLAAISSGRLISSTRTWVRTARCAWTPVRWSSFPSQGRFCSSAAAWLGWQDTPGYGGGTETRRLASTWLSEGPSLWEMALLWSA